MDRFLSPNCYVVDAMVAVTMSDDLRSRGIDPTGIGLRDYPYKISVLEFREWRQGMADLRQRYRTRGSDDGTGNATTTRSDADTINDKDQTKDESLAAFAAFAQPLPAGDGGTIDISDEETQSIAPQAEQHSSQAEHEDSQSNAVTNAEHVDSHNVVSQASRSVVTEADHKDSQKAGRRLSDDEWSWDSGRTVDRSQDRCRSISRTPKKRRSTASREQQLQ